jgi:hypothetical protein
MESCKRIKPLLEYAERIKTDQGIPKKWKRILLAINRSFITETRKYDEALEILRDAKHFSKKVNKGEITPKQRDKKLLDAKRQVEKTKIFALGLSEMVRK